MTGTFDDLLCVAALIVLAPTLIGGIAAVLAWREAQNEGHESRRRIRSRSTDFEARGSELRRAGEAPKRSVT